MDLIRLLWQGGYVSRKGRYFTLENARIFSLPDSNPPILPSGFGSDSTGLAARMGDGYVNTSLDAELVKQYRGNGGRGPAVAAVKICWAEDEASARKLAHDRWRSDALPGQLSQERALPQHFEQACQLVSEDEIWRSIPFGPGPRSPRRCDPPLCGGGFRRDLHCKSRRIPAWLPRLLLGRASATSFLNGPGSLPGVQSGAAATASSHPARILLVEDDPGERAVGGRALGEPH